MGVVKAIVRMKCCLAVILLLIVNNGVDTEIFLPQFYNLLWYRQPPIVSVYSPGYLWTNTINGVLLRNPAYPIGELSKQIVTDPLLKALKSESPKNIVEIQSTKESLHKVGELPEFAPDQHPMRGEIYFDEADDSKIIVKGFYYPQPGPDAFFWAGEDEPSCSEESIKGQNYLLAPGKAGSRDYYNKDQPILPPYSGTEGDIVLTLPPGASVKNLRWICVWCRMFAHNFGTVELKEN